MPELIRMEDLPELEGWLTLPEAAKLLGLTRQRVYQMVQVGTLKSVMKLGDKPTYIIRKAEIEPLVQARLSDTRKLLAQLEAGVEPDEEDEDDEEPFRRRAAALRTAGHEPAM